MRRLARISYTFIRMFNRPIFPKPVAFALARWLVLLTGWVWLGAQGQRLGWALASGVVPVALWWVMRLCFARMAIVQGLPRSASFVLGLLTSLGGLLISLFPQLGFTALLLLAVLWAAWLVLLDSAAAATQCSRRWVGWPPLLAAGLCALAIATPLATPPATPFATPLSTPLVAALIAAFGAVAVPVLLLAAVWLSRDLPIHRTSWCCHTRGRESQPASVISASAMGLMMGTLWLGSAWCSAAGWSNAQVVVLHLALMSVLPSLTRLDVIPSQLPYLLSQRVPLALIVAASLVLLSGTQPTYGLVGMGLLSVAWAIRSSRQYEVKRVHDLWSVLSGPALLLLVGWLSPLYGPQTLQWAYGLLGIMAFIALATTIVLAKRQQPQKLRLSDISLY
jgi:hypothetical protein